MLYTCRLYVFFIFIVCECLALRDGFIYSKEIPLSKQIKHFSFRGSENLVIQHPSQIIVANMDKPNQIVEKIVDYENQTIPFSMRQARQQIFFISNHFLNSQKANNSIYIPIKELTDSTPIIQVDGIVYFFNPKVSTCVLLYDLKKNQLRKGPDLFDSGQFGRPSAIAFDRKRRHLFIGLQSRVYMINMINQLVIQELAAISPLHQIIVNQSQNAVYIIDNNRRISFYKYQAEIYQLYYITPFTNGPEKSGLYFSQSQKICHQISTKRESLTTFSMRNIQSPCLQIMTQTVDQIPANPQLDIFRLGKDKQHIYCIKKSQLPNKIFKYLIKTNKLEEIQSKNWEIPFYDSELTTFEILSNEIMVFKTLGDPVVLWDYKNEEMLFTDAIQKCPFSLRNITLLQFYPSLGQLYLFYTSEDIHKEILSTQFCWLKLDNTQSTIECNNYKNQIKQIIFAHGNIYLLFHQFDDNIIILDEISKKTIQIKTMPFGTDLAVVKGEIFAIKNNNFANKIINFDFKFEQAKSIQVPCSLFDVILRYTDSQLIAICYEQEHLYNTNLEYIASTMILKPELSILSTKQTSVFSTQQTSLRYMRFNQNLGFLIRYNYQPWKISIITNISISFSPSSNFLMVNPTKFIYYHHNSTVLFINLCQIINDKFQITNTVKVSDNITDIFYESYLKLDCSQKYFVVSYLSFRPKLFQDTLFYSVDKFDLHYYYRDVDHQNIEFYQVPYLNCDGKLYSSIPEGLKIYFIAGKSSVNIRELTKDLSISASFDGLSCLVFGTKGEKQSLYLWSAGDQPMTQLFNSMPFSVVSKSFYLGKSIAVLSINQLYFGSENTFTKHRKAISDCSYYSATSIICLTVDSQLFIIDQDQKEVQSFSGKIEGKYSRFSLSEDSGFLILANQNYIKILSWVKSSNLFEDYQTISCHQCDLKQTLINPQGNHILAYSSKNQSIHYWKITHCPPFSQIRDGVCRCTSIQSNNQCFCREGEFPDGQSCSPCSFFCDACSDSAGSCDSFSKTGDIILTSVVWIGIIAVALILKYLRKKLKKRKGKSSENIQSQLLSQDGSING